MIPATIKWPAEAIRIVQKAAEFVHSTFSDFVRQAALEKARKVLGMEPKLPVYTPTLDKKKQ
jgi:uncharacterized protein (DUF1778 family)